MTKSKAPSGKPAIRRGNLRRNLGIALLSLLLLAAGAPVFPATATENPEDTIHSAVSEPLTQPVPLSATAADLLAPSPERVQQPEVDEVFAFFGPNQTEPQIFNPLLVPGSIVEPGAVLSGLENHATSAAETDSSKTFRLTLDLRDRAWPGTSVELFVVDQLKQTQKEAIVDFIESWLDDLTDVPGFNEVDNPLAVDVPSYEVVHMTKGVRPGAGGMVFFDDVPALLNAVYALRMADGYHVIHPVVALPDVELPESQASEAQLQSSSPQTASSGSQVAGWEGRIRSQGAYTDRGTFITFAIGANAPIEVSFRYCYVANTNGWPGYINTFVDGDQVDAWQFGAPFTGDGSCNPNQPSTFGTRSFAVETGVRSEIRFDYANGDWRLDIAQIVVTAGDPPMPRCGGSPRTESSTQFEFSWLPGNYDRGWKAVVEPDWDDLGWGGWRYNWKYWPTHCPEATRVIRDAEFGFGFSGHNRLNGEHVLRFGGSIRSDSCPDWWCGWENDDVGPQPHKVTLSGMKFFYRNPADPGVQHYAAGLVGRPAVTCEHPWEDVPGGVRAKDVIRVLARKAAWLGLATFVADEYCHEEARTATWEGGPGLGVWATGIGTVNDEQQVSGFINTAYHDARKGELKVEFVAMASHNVEMEGCDGCVVALDQGTYQYTVKPIMEVV